MHPLGYTPPRVSTTSTFRSNTDCSKRVPFEYARKKSPHCGHLYIALHSVLMTSRSFSLSFWGSSLTLMWAQGRSPLPHNISHTITPKL